MDNKQKKPAPTGKKTSRTVSDGPAAGAPSPRPARPRPTQGGNGTVKRTQATVTAKEPGTAPKRTPPQGASMHAGYARTRPASSTRPVSRPKTKPKQNALQRLVKHGMDATAKFTSGKEKLRRAQQASSAKRKRRRARMKDTPEVIYTEPKPFNRRRFFLQMVSVAAVVVALMMGLSVFFKVKTITVSGAETYSNWSVREASGIEDGDSLLGFSVARASAQILTQLPYVEEVRIGIKLPDTVNIYIKELDVAYAIKSHEGIWWLITSDGKVVEQADASIAEGYTKILGVTLADPYSGGEAEAFEELSTETLEEGETVPVTTTGSQRLAAAKQILKALEANDIVGEAASVDVTSLNAIELWYGTRYQVNLGDASNMEYKIACMNQVILQMKDYQTGMLDISFTTWKDQVGYTPFT